MIMIGSYGTVHYCSRQCSAWFLRVVIRHQVGGRAASSCRTGRPPGHADRLLSSPPDTSWRPGSKLHTQKDQSNGK